jgi:hypothetical protein
MSIKSRLKELEKKLTVNDPVKYVIVYPGDPECGKAKPGLVIRWPDTKGSNKRLKDQT